MPAGQRLEEFYFWKKFDYQTPSGSNETRFIYFIYAIVEPDHNFANILITKLSCTNCFYLLIGNIILQNCSLLHFMESWYNYMYFIKQWQITKLRNFIAQLGAKFYKDKLMITVFGACLSSASAFLHAKMCDQSLWYMLYKDIHLWKNNYSNKFLSVGRTYLQRMIPQPNIWNQHLKSCCCF